VAYLEAREVDGKEPDCGDPDGEAPDEMAVRDAVAPERDEYVNPLMVESSVGEDASIDEAMDEVLADTLDMVEFVVSAAVRAATTDGSLLAAALEAEDDKITASAATAPMLEEANGYAGTVSVLGNAGTDGTDGREALGTAGTDGTEGRATTVVGTVGSADTDNAKACDGSAGVDGTADWISEGRDAIGGTSGVEAASAAAATADGADGSGTADGAETSVASVTGRDWPVSVGAVESGCVTVVCATTFPAVSTVATTSTFTVKTLPVPA
jgi:hypothetical protein